MGLRRAGSGRLLAEKAAEEVGEFWLAHAALRDAMRAPQMAESC